MVDPFASLVNQCQISPSQESSLSVWLFPGEAPSDGELIAGDISGGITVNSAVDKDVLGVVSDESSKNPTKNIAHVSTQTPLPDAEEAEVEVPPEGPSSAKKVRSMPEEAAENPDLCKILEFVKNMKHQEGRKEGGDGQVNHQKQGEEEKETEDILKVARRRGLTFPKPRWWPAEGYSLPD